MSIKTVSDMGRSCSCFQASLPQTLPSSILGSMTVAVLFFLCVSSNGLSHSIWNMKKPPSLIYRGFVVGLVFFFSKNIWENKEVNEMKAQESQYWRTNFQLRPAHLQFICPWTERDLCKLFQCLQLGFKSKKFLV